jgi:hypothetical protein
MNCLKRIVSIKLDELVGPRCHQSMLQLAATRVALQAQAQTDGFGVERNRMLFPALWHVLGPYRFSL